MVLCPPCREKKGGLERFCSLLVNDSKKCYIKYMINSISLKYKKDDNCSILYFSVTQCAAHILKKKVCIFYCIIELLHRALDIKRMDTPLVSTALLTLSPTLKAIKCLPRLLLFVTKWY